VLLSHDQAKVVFVFELAENIDYKLFGQLLLLLVLEVGIKHKRYASFTDHVVTQGQFSPV